MMEDARWLWGDPEPFAPDKVTWLGNACRVLGRESGCRWAPWYVNGHRRFMCLHGLFVTKGVPRAILEGDEMPDVADWLRREHVDQVALITRGLRPEGHDEPYQPKHEREELPPW